MNFVSYNIAFVIQLFRDLQGTCERSTSSTCKGNNTTQPEGSRTSKGWDLCSRYQYRVTPKLYLTSSIVQFHYIHPQTQLFHTHRKIPQLVNKMCSQQHSCLLVKKLYGNKAITSKLLTTLLLALVANKAVTSKLLTRLLLGSF